MFNIGDNIIVRYNDPSQKPSAHEWYDFKDELEYIYEGIYDSHTWQIAFGKPGKVVGMTGPLYTIKIDNIGELEVSEKMIKFAKRVYTKPTFKITKDLNLLRL